MDKITLSTMTALLALATGCADDSNGNEVSIDPITGEEIELSKELGACKLVRTGQTISCTTTTQADCSAPTMSSGLSTKPTPTLGDYVWTRETECEP